MTDAERDRVADVTERIRRDAADAMARCEARGVATTDLARVVVALASLRDRLRSPRRRRRDGPNPPLLTYHATVGGAEIADPSAYPDALVCCPLMATPSGLGKVLLVTCIQRQNATHPGRSRKNGTLVKRTAGVHLFCASRECAQGRANARRAPAGYKPPRYNPIRPPKEQRAQRAARRKAYLESPPERVDEAPDLECDVPFAERDPL